MKYILAITIILLCLFAFAQQTPNTFKYQTSIRDNTGNLVINRLVALRMSILQGSATGAAVYTEIHNTATTDFGIANINIGGGSVVTGNFNQIDWANGPMFLRVELDLNNGTSFNFMGTSQLLAVPYALFAANAANAADDKDKDSTNELQQINLNNNQLTLNKNGGTVNLDKYLDNTDSQTISLQGNVLSISRGNSIVLSGAIDLDSDPTNEIQNLQIKGDSINLTKGNSIVLPKDNDRDSTNELQSLSVNGNRLSISQRNQVNIDADTTNELQTLYLNNRRLGITKGNEITVDTDTLNEIQVLSLNNHLLSLSRGGGGINIVSPSALQSGNFIVATATGTNNLQLTLNPAPTQYTLGMNIIFRMPHRSNGHVTINVNNLGVRPLFKNIVDTINQGDIDSNQLVSIIFNGSHFELYGNRSNKEEILYLSQIGDYTNNFDGSINQQWTTLRFNNQFKNSSIYQVVNDTIEIKKGVYYVDGGSSYTLAYGGGSSSFSGASIGIRVFNTTYNNIELLGNIISGNINSSSGWVNISINDWYHVNGIISINQNSRIVLQYYITKSVGNTTSVTSGQDLNLSNLLPVRSYLTIKKIQ